MLKNAVAEVTGDNIGNLRVSCAEIERGVENCCSDLLESEF